MASLTPLTYGQVIGRFLSLVGDTTADVDLDPDVVPLSGSITFTPTATSWLVSNAVPGPVTVIPQAITGTLDTNGYLTYNGQQGVYLLATDDPNINPLSFTYSVSFNFKGATYPGFSIDLPAGSVIDLSNVAPVQPSSATPIVRGEPGPPNVLTIGTVSTGTAAATITGTSPAQVLNLTLPGGSGGGGSGTVQTVNGQSPDGTGAVTVGIANISGLSTQLSGLQLHSEKGQVNGYAPLDSSGFVGWAYATAGTLGFVNSASATRPTARSDIKFLWFCPTQPPVVETGTAGMLDGVDSWFQTS